MAETPRNSDTYRGARRNADRVKGWPSATFAKSRPLARTRGVALSRSGKWTRAKTYQQAREMSPSSDAVR